MKTMWETIKESRTVENITSSQQYSNLTEIYSKIDDENILKIADEWFSAQKSLIDNSEFSKLHEENGGIVEGGDDTFYEDFACWVIAQGEELLNSFNENGHKIIIDYIKENKINGEEYTFENMKYSIPDHVKFNYETKKHYIQR